MKLIAIGYLGEQTVYVGISKEEAISKYKEEHPHVEDQAIGKGIRVEELDVNDKFYVYDIWV